MQAVTSVFREDTERQETFATHRQAIECVIQVMHTHLHESLILEDLAAVAYLSPSYFNRVFRGLIGIPPGEFLCALRFQMARRLLLTTPLSVTDICFEVGYTSIGSFTSRFTQLVGLPPRLLRQRAQAFEPFQGAPTEPGPVVPSAILRDHVLEGWISAPATFRGTIYVGLFTSPIPQGAPVRCTKLNASGLYQFHGLADGIYHLRAAAFPIDNNLQRSLLPDAKMLMGNNTSPLIIHRGHISGDRDLILHPPHLTDPPLVMGLPLL